jgi:DNA-binding response OmpR family regulator
LKVLIVEDDLMIADLVEDWLNHAGYEVCGIACDVAEAIDLAARHVPDLAVIDLRLASDELGTDAARALKLGRRIGILYVTGNFESDLLNTAVGEGCLAKPYRHEDFARALEIVVEVHVTGAAPKPYPQGFYLLPRATSLRSEAGLA